MTDRFRQESKPRDFVYLLAQLSDQPKLKGDQFEAICEWTLKNDPMYRPFIASVTPWTSWPRRWCNHDNGIDLVAELRDGSIMAIQCKGYDHALTKASRLDSFLAESNRDIIGQRLIMASTDDLSRNAKITIHGQSKPVSLYLLAQFSSANIQWPLTLDELNQSPPLVEVYPRPHQQLAIEASIEHFSRGARRGQIDMACGTGKSFAGYWINSAVKNETALVLVPSINLVAQLLGDWARAAGQHGLPPTIAVCSDQSATRKAEQSATDSFDINPCFPVTTSQEQIRDFIGGPGPRVVFSTYQSLPVISQAQQSLPEHQFDFLIADEAHRTTGVEGSIFTRVHDDRQVRTRRRLYMTATPRIYGTAAQGRAGAEGVVLHSMDDKETYGPVIYSLPFGEAIASGLLADYRILVLGVTCREIAEQIQQRRLMHVGDEQVIDAESAATLVATRKAMDRFGLRRLLSFHSNRARAERFADTAGTLLGEKIGASFVSGAHSMAERHRKLDLLRYLPGVNGMLLSNAQCLSEGIDVPGIDAVIFADPRSSVIAIVQASGRAIRLDPNNPGKVGMILVPVVIDESLPVEEQVDQTQFKKVFQVVNAMKSQDERLVEELNALRQQIGRREVSGGSEHLDIDLGRIVVDLPADLGPEFERAIRLVIVERTTSSFWARLEELRAWIDHHGDIPPRNSGLLGRWVGYVRICYQRGLLSKEQISALEEMPSWTWNDLRSFEESLAVLHKFVETNRRLPTQQEKIDDISIGNWVINQRQSYKKNSMPPERIAMLESVSGWYWINDSWSKTFSLLQRFVALNLRLPNQSESFDGVKIGTWVSGQRGGRKRGRLSSEQIALLETLPGWKWGETRSFEASVDMLRLFVDSNCRLPRDSEVFDGERIGKWQSGQRRRYKRGELPESRVVMLESITGWEWGKDIPTFDQCLIALRSFVGQRKRLPSQQEKVDGISIGNWVINQRQSYKKGKLPNERIALLESVRGWYWVNDPWMLTVEQLGRFVKLECRLPASNEEFEGFKLGQWLDRQRSTYNKHRLPREQIEQLEALNGWTWEKNLSRLSFGESLDALQRFVVKQRRLPLEREELDGVKIGVWVISQRQRFRKGSLSEDCVASLEAIPEWSWSKDSWSKTFEVLRRFVNLHSRLPSQREEFEGIKIGAWQNSERQKFAKGRIPPKRVELLESIPGWSWGEKRSFSNSLADLRRFIEMHGRLPRQYDSFEGIKIGLWMMKQRQKHHYGTLAHDHIGLLEAVPGWKWSSPRRGGSEKSQE